MILLLPGASTREDERVEFITTSSPEDEKLFLKAIEPKVGQRQEDMKRKREYNYIIFSERT